MAENALVLTKNGNLFHWQMSTTEGPCDDRANQDQTAQNVQSDLGFTLSDKEVFLP